MPAAAPVVATEAAVATTLTAAEIAAAQQAAAHAAQVAAAQTLAAEQAAALAAQQATAATANTAAATATNAATNQSVLQAIGANPAAPASAAQLGGYGGANAIGAGSGISSLGAGAGTGANLGYETLAKEVGTGGIKDIVVGMGENQIATVKPFDFGWADKTNYMIPDPAFSAVSSSVPVPPSPPVLPVVNPGPAPHLSAFRGTAVGHRPVPGTGCRRHHHQGVENRRWQRPQRHADGQEVPVQGPA